MGEELDVGTAGYERKAGSTLHALFFAYCAGSGPALPTVPSPWAPQLPPQRKLKSLGKYSDLAVNTCGKTCHMSLAYLWRSFCRAPPS